MKTRIALVAALLAASTGFAAAQTPPPPPPPPAGAEMPPPAGEGAPPRPGEDGGPGDRPGERGHRWERGPGGPGGKGRDRDGASFHLRMGDTRLMVQCGAEALAPCIEASRPLIDLVGQSGPGPSGLPRPPASDLTVPPIAPPVPGNDTPPVAPAN